MRIRATIALLAFLPLLACSSPGPDPLPIETYPADPAHWPAFEHDASAYTIRLGDHVVPTGWEAIGDTALLDFERGEGSVLWLVRYWQDETGSRAGVHSAIALPARVTEMAARAPVTLDLAGCTTELFTGNPGVILMHQATLTGTLAIEAVTDDTLRFTLDATVNDTAGNYIANDRVPEPPFALAGEFIATAYEWRVADDE